MQLKVMNNIFIKECMIRQVVSCTTSVVIFIGAILGSNPREG